MIYVHAMTSDKTLLALNEYPADRYAFRDEMYARDQKDGVTDSRHGPVEPETALSLPLLLVSKKVHQEAIETFYAVNTFKLSPASAAGKDSVFTKYATLLRKVVVSFGRIGLSRSTAEDFEAFNVPGMRQSLRQIALWKQQIQPLGAMVNLKYLALDICEVGRSIDDSTRLPLVAVELRTALLTHAAMDLQGQAAMQGRGIWMFVSGGNYNRGLDIRSLEDYIKAWKERGISIEKEYNYYQWSLDHGYDYGK